MSPPTARTTTWESFISPVAHDGWGGDAARERDQLPTCLEYEPGREWYLEEDDAHTLRSADQAGVGLAKSGSSVCVRLLNSVKLLTLFVGDRLIRPC